MQTLMIRGIAAMIGAAVTITLAPTATAQQSEFGSIFVRREMLTEIVRDCSAAYPKLSSTLAVQLASWQSDHETETTAFDKHTADLSADKRAELDRLTHALQQSTSGMLATMQQQGQGEEFCANAIKSLGETNHQGSFDADNFEQAIGMYYQNMIAAETARDLCVSRNPEMAKDVDDLLALWRQREAPIASVVKSYIDRMRREEPSAEKKLEETMRRSARELLTTAVDSYGQTYCRKYFDDLAAGNARLKSPQMYHYLEQESSNR